MTRSRPRADGRFAAAILALAVAGCATRSGTVVLLPGEDGRSGALSVQQGGQTLVLDRPYAGAQVGRAELQAYSSNAQEVTARFGAALGAQPAPPEAFTLYFVEQTDELVVESKALLDAIVAAVGRHAAPEIVIVGHTDAVGSHAFNDALSRKRADAVEAALLGRGVAPERMTVTARGKREPALPTRDGVAEPRNRRVEVMVR